MKKKACSLLAVSLAIFALALSACGATTSAPSPSASAPASAKASSEAQASKPAQSTGAAATDAAWQKVIDAAKKEGKVVYYGAQGREAALDLAAATLKKEYGIEMQYSVERGGGREKVLAEVQSGKIIADVTASGLGDMDLLLKANALAKFPTLPNLSYSPKDLVDPQNYLVTLYANTYGIEINTNLVKPADEPKSWKDLIDPKWKGKLLSDDPRTVGGGNMVFGVMLRTFGQDYMQKLAAQQVHFTRSYLDNEKAVARGDYPIYYPAIMLGVHTRLKGTPTKAIVPTEGLPYVAISVGQVKGSAHPNAAAVLINWFLSAEGQKALTATAAGGIRADVDLGVPADVAGLLAGKAKLMGSYSSEELTNPDGVVAQAETVFGKY